MKKLTTLLVFALLSFNVSCSEQTVKTKTITTEQKVTDSPAELTEIKKPEIKKPARDLSKAGKNCICIKMWMPVCGDDKKTYGNACEAQCKGVAFTQGECQAVK